MQRIETGLSSITILFGAIGGIISASLGGWHSGLTALLFFMSADFITGIMVAGIFNKSSKTKSGALMSKECSKGLCRKGMTLFIVLIAYQLDIVAGTAFIRDATIIAYIVNEGISIIENLGVMGVYVPPPLKRAIESLRDEQDVEITRTTTEVTTEVTREDLKDGEDR